MAGRFSLTHTLCLSALSFSFLPRFFPVNGAKYSGLMDAMTKVVESEGSKGLYKGLPQQLTKTVLSAAIGLMLKEKISQAERTFAAMLLKMAKEKK